MLQENRSGAFFPQFRDVYIFTSDLLDSEGVCENSSSWRPESGLYAKRVFPVICLWKVHESSDVAC